MSQILLHKNMFTNLCYLTDNLATATPDFNSRFLKIAEANIYDYTFLAVYIKIASKFYTVVAAFTNVLYTYLSLQEKYLTSKYSTLSTITLSILRLNIKSLSLKSTTGYIPWINSKTSTIQRAYDNLRDELCATSITNMYGILQPNNSF